jgi:hypothetical protein
VNLALVLGFEWDDGNARKNEKHGVTQAEVEQIFFRQPLVITSDVLHSSTEPRYHALGRTDQDRWLQVTFTLRERATLIRPISARAMHRKERPVYEKAIEAHS